MQTHVLLWQPTAPFKAHVISKKKRKKKLASQLTKLSQGVNYIMQMDPKPESPQRDSFIGQSQRKLHAAAVDLLPDRGGSRLSWTRKPSMFDLLGVCVGRPLTMRSLTLQLSSLTSSRGRYTIRLPSWELQGEREEEEKMLHVGDHCFIIQLHFF